MTDLRTYRDFFTVRTLALLGLWEHASFYGAQFEMELQVYRENNELRYDCIVENAAWAALLWTFE